VSDAPSLAPQESQDFPNRLAALMTDDQFKTLVRELRIIQIGIASTAAKDVRN
jgi:hypothetical protein